MFFKKRGEFFRIFLIIFFSYLKIHNTKIPESLLTMSTNSRINDLQFRNDDTQVGLRFTPTHECGERESRLPV